MGVAASYGAKAEQLQLGQPRRRHGGRAAPHPGRRTLDIPLLQPGVALPTDDQKKNTGHPGDSPWMAFVVSAARRH